MFSIQTAEPTPHPFKVDQLKEKMNLIRGQIIGNEHLKNQGAILHAALDYADQKLPVLPLYTVNNQGSCTCGKVCRSPGKHPMTKNGFKNASTCPQQIRTWFEHTVSNIGIATGAVSGLIVIDLDCDKGSSLKSFYDQFKDLSYTRTVKTGRGYHLYFKHPGSEIISQTNVLPGVDIRADGAYIVAPPSRHSSGELYRWENDLCIQECSPSLFEFLISKKSHPVIKATTTNVNGFKEGVRNDSITRVAGFLRSLGLSTEEIHVGIQAMNSSLCNPPLDSQEVFKIATSIGRYEAPKKWTRPKDLPENLTTVPSLTSDILPDKFAPALIDVSERMQVPLEFIAGPAIIAASSVIGRKVRVKPMKHDDWIVVPNLWGMIVADPGSMKSPALAEALRPLENLVRRSRDIHARAMCDFDEHRSSLEIKINSLKEGMKKNNKNQSAIEADLNNLINTHRNLQKPLEKRYKTNDPTIEKLAALLSENPQGVLLFRDEISGWIEKMTKQTQRGDKEFYLETWSGDSAYTVDRIERGTLHVDPLCLSVLGGIQPAKLKKYLQTYEKHAGNDGFLERFQVTFIPQQQTQWNFVDRSPDLKARDLFEESFNELDRIPHDDTQIFKFSSTAQNISDEWRYELEQENLKKGMHPILKGHFSKYRSLMPSLALIIELLGNVESQNQISENSVNKAIAWCSILKIHAIKFYGALIEQKVSAAHILADRIKSGRFTDGMKLRDIARKNWPMLKNSDQIEDACDVLESCNWIRVDRRKVPGGNSGFVFINPEIIKQQRTFA